MSVLSLAAKAKGIPYGKWMLVVVLLAVGCSAADDSEVTGPNLSGRETVTTTLPSASTSAATFVVQPPTVTMLTEPGNACVRNPDGPYVDSFPVAGSVDSVEVSDGCVLAAVVSGEVLTLTVDGLVPMFDDLPFHRVMSAFFVGESLWLGGRVGECFEFGFFADEVWQEVVDPNGGVTCGDQGGFSPIGVSGDKVIFARYPDDRLVDGDFQVELVVYEAGTWTDYGKLNGPPLGVAVDALDTVWVALWSGGIGSGDIARCDRESCTYANAPGAVMSSQVYGIASGNDGDIWVLARNALSRFDGETWTSYTSAVQNQKWGEYLEEYAESVVEVTFLDIDGSPLEPQPDFFGALGQPFDIDVASTGDVWLGVRFHPTPMEGGRDSLVHISGTMWTVHPLDDASFDIVPEMVAIGGSAVWFAHYNIFGDESGNSAEPHIYRYVQPAE